MVRCLVFLYVGLLLCGVSIALMVDARLGLDPWDVFHQGLARWTGLRFGWVVVSMSALVLMLWISLRQQPGIGTLSDVLLVGLVVDAALAWLPQPRHLIPARRLPGHRDRPERLGHRAVRRCRPRPGARDGLMTGLARRGHSIRAVHIGIEVTVLGA